MISNYEFDKLVKNQSNRLKSIAAARYSSNPKGNLSDGDIDKYAELCARSGDKKAANWLKSLKKLHSSGMLDRIKNKTETWHDHGVDITRRVAQKTLPFDLNDSVMHKDTGKRGQVVDYNVNTEKYVVVFNPFQVEQYYKDELVKVG